MNLKINTAFLLLIAGLLAVFGMAVNVIQEERSQHLSPGQHELLIQQLNQIISIEQQLRDNLGKARANVLPHYDTIVDNVNELETVLQSIVITHDTSEDSIIAINSQLAHMNQSFENHQQVVEDVKSALAAIHISLRYLPILILESSAKLGATEAVIDAHHRMMALLDHSLFDDEYWFNHFLASVDIIKNTDHELSLYYANQIENHVRLVKLNKFVIDKNFPIIHQGKITIDAQNIMSMIIGAHNDKDKTFHQIQFALQLAVLFVSALALLGFYRASLQSIKLTKENAYRARINTALGKLAEFDNRRTHGEFFDLCVQNLVNASNCHIAFVAFFENGSCTSMETVAVNKEGIKEKNFIYELKGAPCEDVIQNLTCSVECGVATQYPDDAMLADLQLEAYFGQALLNAKGEPIGLIALTYQEETKYESWLRSLIEIFATRISIELERSEALDALSEEREEVLTTLNAIADGVIQVNVNGIVTDINPAGRKLLELDNWSKQSNPSVEDICLSPDGNKGNQLAEQVRQCIETRQTSTRRNEVSLLTNKSDAPIVVNLSVAPVFDNQRNVQGVIAVMNDMSHEMRYRQELAYQANHDSLTGLLNRRALDAYLKNVLARATPSHPFALLYIDMDRFKIINDTCGHSAGDALLREFTSILLEQIRGNDTLARLGGDEFLISLENCMLENAESIASKILHRTQMMRFFWDDNEFEISVSIGITVIDSNTLDNERILSAVDMACLNAKNNGRNQLSVASLDDPTISNKKTEGLWIQRLNNAISNDLFELYHQPIVEAGAVYNDTDDKCYRNVEILLRMRDGEGKLVSPHVFLGAAERYDMMPRIDFWVINNVLARMDGQIEFTSLKDTEHVAINLSGQSIASGELLDFILTKLDNYSIAPNRLCFEVTETAAIANFTHATKLITELQAIGCTIALDDFGSGLSSYGYIKNLPADILKIDQEFTRNLENDQINRAIVQSVISVAHNIGMTTIAEGIEDDVTRQIVEDFGVDYVQGYGLGYPQPIKPLTIESHIENRA